MSSMIERAAIQACAKFCEGANLGPHPDLEYDPETIWADLEEPGKQAFRAAVLAAIDALMEPTPEVTRAFWEAYQSRGPDDHIDEFPCKVWQAMLRAAKEETP